MPFEKMEDRDDIWKNVTSRSVLDKKHKKNDISSQIVTSDNDMSELVRKLRGSRDLLQRRSSGDGYIPKEQYSWKKTMVLSEYNLRLPTNDDHFEDGNHQKQVTTLYGIICLKKATKFVVTKYRLPCFQKVVLVCFLLRRQQKIKTCRNNFFCVYFELPQQVSENEELLQSTNLCFILPLDRR